MQPLKRSIKHLKDYLTSPSSDVDIEYHFTAVCRHKKPSQPIEITVKQSEVHSSIDCQQIIEDARKLGIILKIRYDIQEQKEAELYQCTEQLSQLLIQNTPVKQIKNQLTQLAQYCLILNKKEVRICGEFHLTANHRKSLEKYFQKSAPQCAIFFISQGKQQMEASLQKIAGRTGWNIKAV